MGLNPPGTLLLKLKVISENDIEKKNLCYLLSTRRCTYYNSYLIGLILTFSPKVPKIFLLTYTS